MVRGGTWILRLFCGSYPSNALLSERLNVPKSDMVTFLPLVSASEIISVSILMVLAAVDFGMSALAASCSVKSFLLNLEFRSDVIMSVLWNMKLCGEHKK